MKREDVSIYFNWSANVLMPVSPRAADVYLMENYSTILGVAQELLDRIGFAPSTIYRGIILRDDVDEIRPHENLKYLSFSESRSVAEHFADVNGFGSEFFDMEARLGSHGYVIEHTPTADEILFHYKFLQILPYARAFSLLGMDGPREVLHLGEQREITILQPGLPFTNVEKMQLKKQAI